MFSDRCPLHIASLRFRLIVDQHAVDVELHGAPVVIDRPDLSPGWLTLLLVYYLRPITGLVHPALKLFHLGLRHEGVRPSAGMLDTVPFDFEHLAAASNDLRKGAIDVPVVLDVGNVD